MSLEPFHMLAGTQAAQFPGGAASSPLAGGGWGFSMPKYRARSRSTSTWTMELTGALPETPVAFNTTSTTVPTPGDPTTINKWSICTFYDSGSNVIFVGRLTEVRGLAHPDGPRTLWTFSDAWWDLQNITFQHFWQMTPTGSGTPTPVGSGKGWYFESQLNLFSDIMDQSDTAPWNYMTVDVQIAQIVLYVAEFCSIPIYATAQTPASISPTPSNMINWMTGMAVTGFPTLTVNPPYIVASDPSIDPEYGTWNMPLYGVKGITCAEAILLCLKNDPSAITWFDYSTTPPTLHVTARANCTGLTLPYAGNSGSGATLISHKSSDIKSRPDLQAAGGVVIQYKQVDYIPSENAYATEYGTDAWGPLSGGMSPVYPTGQELVSLVCPIDLAGYQQTNLSGLITVRGDLSSFGAINVASDAFWELHKPDLKPTAANGLFYGTLTGPTTLIQDTTVNGGSGHPYGITVLDDNGNTVNPSGMYELVDGNVAAWMTDKSGTPITVIWVTVTAFLQYHRYNQNPDASAAFVDQANLSHPTTVRIRLTNAPTSVDISDGNAQILSGSLTPPAPADQWGNIRMNYTAIGSQTQPEYPPVGLAQNIYETLSVLQWEGEHVILSQNIVALYGPQYVLNLLGGLTTWETMNAVIYDVEHDFFYGRTTINFGPFKDLSVQAFFDLLMMWRVRFMRTNPNAQVTGTDSATSQIDGSGTPKENSGATGLPPQELSFVSTARTASGMNTIQTVCGFDANGVSSGGHQGAMVMGQYTNGVLDTTGTALNGYVQASVYFIPPGVGLKFQCVNYLNSSCGVVHRWVLCSDEISGPC